ncbi:MAG: hypothetical protein ACWGMZ_09770, partial [Thermoguttaceae bacterium]
AIGPLINALATTHKYKINKSGGNNSTSATFGNAPGAGGLAVGGGPKILIKRISNQAVLDALSAITGQNFAFNQQLWFEWFKAQKRSENVDARRD